MHISLLLESGLLALCDTQALKAMTKNALVTLASNYHVSELLVGLKKVCLGNQAKLKLSSKTSEHKSSKAQYRYQGVEPTKTALKSW